MKKAAILFMSIFMIFMNCKENDDPFNSNALIEDKNPEGCPDIFYPNWETSKHLLPFPVDQSYTIGRSHCYIPEHAAGSPDQFAIDIEMEIGTLVTASRKGTIMFVEESGVDYDQGANNLVVLRDEDGYFLQYHHLTQNGAIVEQGQFVEEGDPIGYSGVTGDADYPHLHFVATDSNWEYPYTSYPITFRNTSKNEKSLIQGQTYKALPFD